MCLSQACCLYRTHTEGVYPPQVQMQDLKAASVAQVFVQQGEVRIALPK